MDTQTESSFIQNASRHLQAALRNERALTRWIQHEDFERNRLAFRAIDSNISDAGGCILDVGLFSRDCGEDRQQPWKRELVVQHLTYAKGLPSPYLSISTSPQKTVNFIRPRVKQKEIVVLDMIMLDIMGVKYRSTTSLHDEYKFRDAEDGRTYVTDTHYLVYEHIPQCCILGFMSAEAFTKLWETKLGQNEQDQMPASPRALDWHADLVGNVDLRTTSPLCKHPRFAAPSQPSPARTPSSTRLVRTVPSLENSTLHPETCRTNHFRTPSSDRSIVPESVRNTKNYRSPSSSPSPPEKRRRTGSGK